MEVYLLKCVLGIVFASTSLPEEIGHTFCAHDYALEVIV